MKQYDFFVSYSSEDDALVSQIFNSLEKMGAKCWFAPRDSNGRYAKSISDAIENSKVFLLFLSKSSADSYHVLNEIETVNRKRKRGNNDIVIQPVCIERIEMDDPCFDEIMYYISRINFISPSNLQDAHAIAKEIIEACKSALGWEESPAAQKERTASLYYSSEREDTRLAIQTALLKRFDADVYSKICKEYPTPRVLDIGCGDGFVITDRLSDCVSYELVGIDRDEQKLAKAQRKYPQAHFYVADIEAENFSDVLRAITQQSGIEQFDIINISMVLLHLKSQCKLLRVLRRFLAPDGVLIIKDIDDGINFAYPTEDVDFERVYKICDSNETSGERRNGRQIYTNLVRAGYRNISLEKQGLTSIGMNFDEKEDFFHLYFRLVLGDIRWMKQKYPDNVKVDEDCRFMEDNYEKMYEIFMKDDFVFSLGFQIYLARR